MGSANAWGFEARDDNSRQRRWRVSLVSVAILLVGAPALAQSEAPAEPPPITEAEEAAPSTPNPPESESEAPVEPSGPHTANSLQLGIGFRYGAMLNDGDLNPWATGLGLDVGYTLPNAIYVGGNFEYFFGSTSDFGPLKASSNIWQLSAEGGYDLGLGQHFVIRPKVGVGVAGVKTSFEGCSATDACDGANVTKPAIAPGATFMFFANKFSLAVDVRYDIVLADPSLRGLIFSFGIGF